MRADLRLGRWQDVLEGEECDASISDAPYGKRDHAGHNAARGRKHGGRREIDYAHWTRDDVFEYVRARAPLTRRWIVNMTSHDLIPAHEEAFADVGWYSFAPVPFVDVGSRVRLQGDGPSCWTVFLMIARPRTREAARWGTTPGAYLRSPGDSTSGRIGGKPLGVMRAIVRDYSRPGDLVCDPFAGHATTLLAAVTEGRRAIGAEVDPQAYADAMARLGQGYTPDLFAGLPMVGCEHG